MGFGSVSKVDPYIIDNFFAFVHHKKRIHLNMLWMADFAENPMVQLFMHSLREQQMDAVMDNNKNLFKPLLFELFTNVQDITLHYTKYYAFSFLSLLSMLKNAALPTALKTITVTKTNAFSDSLKEQYQAQGL